MKIIPEAYQSKNINQALAHVVEECGEVIANFGKATRFGFDSLNPEKTKEEQESKMDSIIREISDLEQAIRVFNTFVR
jgi:predicted DNA-binding helix-hairpin-helix protein